MSTVRALAVAEKTILCVIAGAAALTGVVELVLMIQRVVSIASGPVAFTDVPTSRRLDAGFAGATFDSVSFTVAELSGGGRAALIGAAVVSSLLTLGICVVLTWLCVRVLRGKPFVASATWGIAIVAILVFATGMGAPVLTGIAEAEAALAIGADELPLFLVEVDLGPIAWGAALAVVAAAFQLGQSLQRDTDGLV